MSITFRINKNVATLTLNRPKKRNALNQSMIKDLLEYVKQIKKDKSIAVVVLKGSGKDFCAGADIQEAQESGLLHEAENKERALAFTKLLFALNYLGKPLLGVVQGRVLGGGIGLVACCDIVIASTRTQFCFPEVKLGLVPALISP